MEQHKACFDDERYREIIRCRNTVAHGLLLGSTEDGEVAFLVQETVGLEENRTIQNVDAYSENAFEALAKRAEHIIPQLEQILKLRAPRKRRLRLNLVPHPKARAPKTPNEGGGRRHRP